ncbi:hypothetical protein LENED_000776 [Lentinula edodes]|uniref:Uncharacterized protein n=1 Tax=Lentinula edodes TaxID=5353 RepID=A0A1Q3DWI5_LENED|nr:hypothetical protein LENED_000776 [Lentinula edodes]
MVSASTADDTKSDGPHVPGTGSVWKYIVNIRSGVLVGHSSKPGRPVELDLYIYVYCDGFSDARQDLCNPYAFAVWCSELH